MKHFLTVAVAVIFLAFSLVARQPADIMDSVFRWQSKHQLLMGNLLVAEKGQIIFKGSYGMQNVENNIPNSDSSAFALASIAKVFTSTAILQLKEKGLLKLNDRFDSYFPDFPYHDITIRHLLTHTSGLPEYELFDSLAKAYPDRIFTDADIIPALKTWTRSVYFKPGTNWRYSSMNFCLLSLLIGKLSGLTLDEYFTEHIYKPAGMKQTYVENYVIVRANKYRTANYQSRPLSHSLINVDSVSSEHTMIFNYGGFTGQGSLTSTTTDLLLFDKAFFGKQLISESSIKEALTPVELNNGKKALTIAFPGYGESYYGLGWFICKDNSQGKIVYHPGGRPGVGTMYVHNLDREQVVILLENMAAPAASASSASALLILNNQPPMAQKIALAKEFAIVLYNNGPEAAASLLAGLRSDSAHYYLNPRSWLDQAKNIFMAGLRDRAIDMLKTGAELFPGEPMISLAHGDALSAMGKKTEAIMMYKKCISLDPKNENAKRKLAQLEADQ